MGYGRVQVAFFIQLFDVATTCQRRQRRYLFATLVTSALAAVSEWFHVEGSSSNANGFALISVGELSLPSEGA